MKKWLLFTFCLLVLAGCRRYEPIPEDVIVEHKKAGRPGNETSLPEDDDLEKNPSQKAASDLEEDRNSTAAPSDRETASEKDVKDQKGNGEETGKAALTQRSLNDLLAVETFRASARRRVKVKGIYVSGYAAGTRSMMDEILRRIGETEINTVVIDVKDDKGRVTYRMDNPLVEEIGSVEVHIGDLPGLIKRMKDQGLYVIARVAAFRDPYLAEARPEWCLKTGEGKVYKDGDEFAWLNPYRPEVWDYLIQIGKGAAADGFDEIQFDYIRFSTGQGMNQVVIPEEETKGRSKTDIITEFTRYAREQLKPSGVYVSADVYGTIIESSQDARTIGQIYQDMAAGLDYICPMIYPSHYGDGNFGLDHPDLHPYETVLAALHGSRRALEGGRSTPSNADGKTAGAVPGTATQAVVRPWLQDFTAAYLENHMEYGPEQVRQQIQAVYDAGYEEWILWDSACTYTWGGLEPRETGGN